MVYLKGIASFIWFVGGQYCIELLAGVWRWSRKVLPEIIAVPFLLWAGLMLFPDATSRFYAFADKNYPAVGKFIRETDSFLANRIFQGPLRAVYTSPVRHYEFVTRERDGYNTYVSGIYKSPEFNLKNQSGFQIPQLSNTGNNDSKWKFIQSPASAYFPAYKNRNADGIKAIYLSGGSATRKRLPDFVKYALKQKINGVVFDIKDVYGFVNYPSAIPEVKKTQGRTPPPIRNLRETISYLHKNGLYAIARVTLFQDELFAKHYPTARISLKGGGPLLTKGRAIWVDPNKTEVRNYNLGIIRETLQAGADEIQLDYVRYPAEGDWKLAQHHGIETHEEKPLVITSYLQQIHTLTQSYGAKLSLDVFGVVAWQEPLDIKSTGQNMKLLSQSADVISPMLYPSHFGNAFAGINKPADKPVHFIQEGCVKLREIIPQQVVIRPWLQAFGWRVTNYTPAYITAQINGAKNAGVNGYLLWNAGNIYTGYSDPLNGEKSRNGITLSVNLADKYFPEACFELPDELIARYPADPPDTCRLLVKPVTKGITHTTFKNLPDFLRPGDTLIYNNSRVQARRIYLKREKDGKIHESLFLSPLDNEKKIWEVMVYRSRKLKPNEILSSEKNPGFLFKFDIFEGKTCLKSKISLTSEIFDLLGEMPIPPYFNRRAEETDKKTYQNFFAQNENIGSAASPTAGLHFTDELKQELERRGINFAPVSLAIGYGTFAPLREENFEQKKLHAEYYELPPQTVKCLREKPGRIICIGTTALRVTETVHRLTAGKFDSHLKGFTDIFLFPPDTIQSADGLITNFHLPGSSLFLLTACITDIKSLSITYEEAIRKKYHFYSYGDAMFLTMN